MSAITRTKEIYVRHTDTASSVLLAGLLGVAFGLQVSAQTTGNTQAKTTTPAPYTPPAVHQYTPPPAPTYSPPVVHQYAPSAPPAAPRVSVQQASPNSAV